MVMMIDNHCRDLDYIVSAGNDGDINFWDARDGEWVQSYEVSISIVPPDVQGEPVSKNQQKINWIQDNRIENWVSFLGSWEDHGRTVELSRR